MEMDLNNRLTEDETLEQAYDIFLELAVDNLDPADVILFNLQFEERGGAELFDPSEDWAEHVDFDLNPDFFAEVVIGLADEDGGEINDILRASCCVVRKTTSCATYSGANNKKAAIAAFLFNPVTRFRSGCKTARCVHDRPVAVWTFAPLFMALKRAAHVRGNKPRRNGNYRIPNQNQHGCHNPSQRRMGRDIAIPTVVTVTIAQ